MKENRQKRIMIPEVCPPTLYRVTGDSYRSSWHRRTSGRDPHSVCCSPCRVGSLDCGDLGRQVPKIWPVVEKNRTWREILPQENCWKFVREPRQLEPWQYACSRKTFCGPCVRGCLVSTTFGTDVSCLGEGKAKEQWHNFAQISTNSFKLLDQSQQQQTSRDRYRNDQELVPEFRRTCLNVLDWKVHREEHEAGSVLEENTYHQVTNGYEPRTSKNYLSSRNGSRN